MRREVHLVLEDILEAIEIAVGICDCLSFEKFSKSRLEKFAVQRAIEIISEAARHLPDEELEKYPAVPWRKVKAMGNILRHEYHHLNDKIVWDVVRNELPGLKAQILEKNPCLHGDNG